MKQVPLADVLWEAANVWLPDGVSYSNEFHNSPFSCDACHAARRAKNVCYSGYRLMMDFIASLGLQDAENKHNAFDDFEDGEVRQGVRHLWLLLAMHVAEDEGIMVEVA